MAAPRADMVQSAVSFLADPAVATSPLEQRVSFLTSKGLTQAEIEEALRIAPQQQQQQVMMAGSQVGAYAGRPYAGAMQPYYGPGPAQQQGRDWRDWFIMAVVSGTVGYGVISLAKKYLFPHLAPPNADVLTTDLEALTAKYDVVSAQLAALETSTEGVKAGVAAQREAVDAGIREVEEAVKAMREGEGVREKEMKRIGEEVEEMKKSLPKMFEKTQAAQADSLKDLQTELKSLKSLLVSRSTGASAPRTYGSPAAASSPRAETASGPFGIKPSIPAWQLANDSSTPAAATPAAGSSAGSDEERTRGEKGGESAPATPYQLPA